MNSSSAIIPFFGLLLAWPFQTMAASSEKEAPYILKPSKEKESQKAEPVQEVHEHPPVIPHKPKDYYFEGASNPLLNKTFDQLDKIQNWVGSYVEDIGESADSFFGTQESFDRTQGSRLDVMTPITFHENGKIDTRVKFRAKVALPRTNKRWNLIVQSAENALDDYASGGSASATTSNNRLVGTSGTDDDTVARVGLRYMLDVKDYTNAFVDFGLNFRNVIEPDPYARVKGTYKWHLADKLYSRMVQDLFWESYAGVGFNSKQTFDYEFNQQNLIRSQTEGTWWDKDQYYELHQTFYFYQTMNVHRAIAYHVGWDWDTKDVGPHLISYHTGFNWRERIYKKWLFFEMEPRIDFDQDTNFRKADPNITFMLEAQFYDRRLNP